MITIYNHLGDTIGSGSTSAEAAIKTFGVSPIVVYADYTKGTETSANLTFDVLAKSAGLYFPLQKETDTGYIDYKISLDTSKKHRILLQISPNEEMLKVVVTFSGDLTTPGTLRIWLVPGSYSFK